VYLVAILGSSGMIGHEISNQLSKDFNFKVFNFQRKIDNTKSNIIQFDILSQNQNLLAREFKEFDYIINCAGIIKHLIDQTDRQAIKNVEKINTEFPKILSDALENTKTKIIEIGTDCVFKGEIGNYSENSIKDATDIYGKSKIFGEFESGNVMRIRTSVIGLEVNRSIELLSWFLAKKNEQVEGYTNHFWNGITSYHLGKIVRGLITNDLFRSGIQHFFPADKVSKFSLLQIFQEVWDRKDLEIKPVETSYKIDRTLNSVNKEMVNDLWRAGGYIEVPNVKQLVAEYYSTIKRVYNWAQ
jgi:dTDP-4-dehydrorhamnose reductase